MYIRYYFCVKLLMEGTNRDLNTIINDLENKNRRKFNKLYLKINKVKKRVDNTYDKNIVDSMFDSNNNFMVGVLIEHLEELVEDKIRKLEQEKDQDHEIEQVHSQISNNVVEINILFMYRLVIILFVMVIMIYVFVFTHATCYK